MERISVYVYRSVLCTVTGYRSLSVKTLLCPRISVKEVTYGQGLVNVIRPPDLHLGKNECRRSREEEREGAAAHVTEKFDGHDEAPHFFRPTRASDTIFDVKDKPQECLFLWSFLSVLVTVPGRNDERKEFSTSFLVIHPKHDTS